MPHQQQAYHENVSDNLPPLSLNYGPSCGLDGPTTVGLKAWNDDLNAQHYNLLAYEDVTTNPQTSFYYDGFTVGETAELQMFNATGGYFYNEAPPSIFDSSLANCGYYFS